MGSLDRLMDEQITLSMSGKARRKAKKQKASLKMLGKITKRADADLGKYKMKTLAKVTKLEANMVKSKKNSKECERAIAACYKHFK